MNNQNGLVNMMIQTLISNVESNPRFANNPRAKELLDIIKSGDQQKGIEVANNILNSYGETRESGMQKAISFFNRR